MKKLTGGAHQASDDLTVANEACSWHASFSRTTVHSGMQCQTCSLLVGCEW